MEKKTIRKIVAILLITLLTVIEFFVMKNFIILYQDETGLGDVKSIRYLNKGEVEGLYGIEETNVSGEKITQEASSEPITLSKTNSSDIEGSIYEGQIQKFTIKVKNNTNEEIKNVSVKDTIPAELVYATEILDKGLDNGWVEEEGTTQFENTIESLKANEEVEMTYYARVKKVAENIGKTVGTKANATIEGNAQNFESNLIQSEIKEGKLQVDLTTAENNTYDFSEGTVVKYVIKVKNITSDTVNGVVLTDIVPDGLKFVNSSFLYYDSVNNRFYEYANLQDEDTSNDEPIKWNDEGYNPDKKMVTWNLGDIESGKTLAVMLEVQMDSMPSTDDNIEIINKVTGYIGEEEYYSNKNEINQINKVQLAVEMTSTLQDTYLYEEDEFEYILNIKNNSSRELANLNIEDVLPTGIRGIEAIYTVNGGEESNCSINTKASMIITLKEGEELKLRLKVRADKLAEGVNELEIKNSATIQGDSIKGVTTNELVNIIKKREETPDKPTDPDNPTDPDKPTDPNNPTDPENPEDPTKPSEESEYEISGIVWIDENKSGSRDKEEEGLQDINVKLLDENMKVMKDSDGKIIESKTGNDGKYVFSNLKKGNYILFFEYSTSDYTITQYQKSGVNEALNSDATLSEIDYNGAKIKGGITKTITIVDKNIENIDMGLIENVIFDLKLEKYINQVSIEDTKGTKVIQYDDTSLAKIEIDKKLLNNTKVIVKYKITVTNEGEIPGYATKIIDYLPE